MTHELILSDARNFIRGSDFGDENFVLLESFDSFRERNVFSVAAIISFAQASVFCEEWKTDESDKDLKHCGERLLYKY